MKIGIVCSPGGHLFQAFLLKEWWVEHDHFWVCPASPDANDLLEKEKLYVGYGPENRSITCFVKNLLFAMKVLFKEKPNVLFSTGAGIAPPFFIVARLFNIKTVYLEPYDFINTTSLTARLIGPFSDVILVQHRTLLSKLKRSVYWGAVL